MDISDQLGELMKLYDREAQKCLRSRAYLPAVIMQAAALEAGLQAMCFLYPEAVKKSLVFQNKQKNNKQFRAARRNKALHFTLNELIKIAVELKWFPPKLVTWAGKRDNVAGFTHEIRKARNRVHPGVWAKERDPLRFTRGVYDTVYDIYDVANSWLLHRVEESLRKAMKREGRM